MPRNHNQHEFTAAAIQCNGIKHYRRDGIQGRGYWSWAITGPKWEEADRLDRAELEPGDPRWFHAEVRIEFDYSGQPDSYRLFVWDSQYSDLEVLDDKDPEPCSCRPPGARQHSPFECWVDTYIEHEDGPGWFPPCGDDEATPDYDTRDQEGGEYQPSAEDIQHWGDVWRKSKELGHVVPASEFRDRYGVSMAEVIGAVRARFEAAKLMFGWRMTSM